MKKRLFSILLALCMVLCLVPTTAFAESETEEPPVCTCETACTAEAMNADCPICGAEGALPENCAKCSGPVEDAAAEPEVEDNEAQPEASPVVLSGKREIKSEAELNVALGDKSCTEITLGENIELSGGYIISHTVTLDLNGYTLTSGDTECDIFSVRENGNLTVMDSGTGGKIDGQNKNCGFCIYGGVLTLESGTIINCMTDGDGSAVDISSGDSEGVYGKFVMNGGAITNCKATDDGGAVDIGKGCTFIMNSGTISGCRADDDAGAIFIKGNASFEMKGGTIKNLTVAGNVSSSSSQCGAGGIVGYASNAVIKNCSNHCSVSGSVSSSIGGIAGYNDNNAKIIECYNVGTIKNCSDYSPLAVGGIAGQNNGTISNCYNVGTVSNGDQVGEIVGFNFATVENCYYLDGTGLNAVGNGSAKDNVTKTEAKSETEFADGTEVLALLKAGERDNNADPWADECQYLDAAGKTLPVFNGQGDAHDHQSNDWKSNETEHWQVCTCGAVFHKAAHSGGTATCTQRATCTVCGAEYGDVLGHDFTTSWTHDDNEHWKQCSRCDEKDDVGPHTWDNGTITTAPTCTKAGEETYSCTKCGATKIEPIPATGHSWKSDWTSDATHHWHECTNKNCDVTDNAGKKGYAEHSGGKATCTQNFVCEICKASYGSLDPNNHTDLKHIDAKAATAAEEGNIAYWYCGGCKKYFSDAAATKEITKAATVTAKLPPKITAGDGAAVTQGEKKELTFTSDASFADFVRVELDGTALEEKNYTKREGSTIITLNRDFVAALSVGEHTLAIVSQHGTATAKFTVKAKPAETATPQPTVTPQPTAQPTQTAQPQPTVQPVSPILRTGDTANPALWFALLIVSGGAAIGITIVSRKKKHNK